MTNQHPINNDWQQVVDYYNTLPDETSKKAFLSNLTLDQKHYLLDILSGPKDLIITEPSEKELALIKTSRDKTAKANILAKLPFFHKKFNRKNIFSKQKDHTVLMVTLSSVFGIIAFITSGLIFNFNNTVVFIRQIPVFGSVLGINTPQSKDVYYDRFSSWNEANKSDYKPDEDTDRDGLSNIDEFIWGSDLTNSDQNKNGIIDGQDFLSGINPTSLELINHNDADSFKRLELMASKNEVHNLLFSYSWGTYADYLKEKQLAPKSVPETYTVNSLSTSDQIEYTIDLSKALTIDISKLDLKNQKIDYEDSATPVLDLLDAKTITHLFASPLPGQKGVSMFVMPNLLQSDKSSLTTAASDLYSLGPNTRIDITGKTKSGETIVMQFEVIKNNLYSLDDINYSNQLSESQIAISTSHPTDSQEKRIMVVAKLTTITLGDSTNQTID